MTIQLVPILYIQNCLNSSLSPKWLWGNAVHEMKEIRTQAPRNEDETQELILSKISACQEDCEMHWKYDQMK